MTFKTPIFALAFVGLASPLLGETDCGSEWVLIGRALNAQASGAVLDGSQCHVENVTWLGSATADSLNWNIPDLTQAVLDDRLPYSVNIKISGMVEDNPSPEMGALAGKPVDLALDYSWDTTSRILNLSEIAATFDDGQSARVQGKLSGLDLSSMQISAMQAALTDLDVRLSGDDLLALILNPALEELAENEASQVKAAHDFVDQLPQASFDLGTRLALKSLATALPTPKDVRITMTSETGLSVLRMMPVMRQDDPNMAEILAILFSGATVDVTYPWNVE
ncbi:hypothetical protein [Halocynthiibacter namhaensis]|uniref:hypothetical protein n=1 Tax=Halocynthiibacter namhaensis TaxID=1290553 RepID=UPI000578F06D|nr:hypothetical protein [Halocynthiibacter namhaensis]